MNRKVRALKVGLFAFPHIDRTWQAFDDFVIDDICVDFDDFNDFGYFDDLDDLGDLDGLDDLDDFDDDNDDRGLTLLAKHIMLASTLRWVKSIGSGSSPFLGIPRTLTREIE